jgi:pilus assembly protein Flp/PilA
MQRLAGFWTRLREDDSAASAVEYAILIAGIAALVVVSLFTLGGAVQDVFERVETCLRDGPFACNFEGGGDGGDGGHDHHRHDD